MSRVKMGPQDMPPSGGYAPFQIERIPLRSLFKGKLGLGIFVAVNLVSWPLYIKNWVEVRKSFIERKSNELAVLPLLIAEDDRAKLKYMRRLRDLEADVMKDFPFWEVGTLFGTPIYESLPKDTFIEPTVTDMYVFADRFTTPVYQYDFMIT